MSTKQFMCEEEDTLPKRVELWEFELEKLQIYLQDIVGRKGFIELVSKEDVKKLMRIFIKKQENEFFRALKNKKS